ncbi:hypothetical protein Fcan01_28473 [Folsomia candida]|uniref:Uncharacterized protein n=1 Tax=Folsomia candida TaxID=158441 RepID=A0A226CW63_FOLCA|nr:hypothetical protein Fcan01_28473 [Folsomia candida]
MIVQFLPQAFSIGTDEQSQSVPCTNTQSSVLSSSASVQTQSSQTIHTITGVKTCKSTQNQCFICGCKTGRTRLPAGSIRQAWQLRQIFIPLKNRCCKSHLVDGKFTFQALEDIEVHKLGVELSGDKLFEWMVEMR